MFARHKVLEELATDEAMGVEFGECGQSTFPDGSSAVSCTACAERMIELAGNGVVVGWADGTNPHAVVNGGHGHDFAIIDDRYLVDAWAKCVECSTEWAVWDLTDNDDWREVNRLYGDYTRWKERRTGGRGWKPFRLKREVHE